MLADFGKPYQSTKGRPEGGLGLFLVVNVARTLGGKVQRPQPPRRRRRGDAAPCRWRRSILEEEEDEWKWKLNACC